MSAITVDLHEVTGLAKALNSLAKDGKKRAFGKAGRDMAKELTRLHILATQTWVSYVVPNTTVLVRGDGMTVVSKTDNEIFSLLTVGARAHTIVPVNAPALVFPWGGRGSYIAKTAPGTLAASAGSGRDTGPITYRGIVNHPGFPAREYHEMIADEVLPFAVRALAIEIARELARL